MTTSTFFAIMLALFLGAVIMVAMYYRYRADNILRTSRSQQIQINAYRDANRDPTSLPRSSKRNLV